MVGIRCRLRAIDECQRPERSGESGGGSALGGRQRLMDGRSHASIIPGACDSVGAE